MQTAELPAYDPSSEQRVEMSSLDMFVVEQGSQRAQKQRGQQVLGRQAGGASGRRGEPPQSLRTHQVLTSVAAAARRAQSQSSESNPVGGSAAPCPMRCPNGVQTRIRQEGDRGQAEGWIWRKSILGLSTPLKCRKTPSVANIRRCSLAQQAAIAQGIISGLAIRPPAACLHPQIVGLPRCGAWER